MSRLIKAGALVLRARRLGEKDKLLTLFSPEIGKAGARAPGACNVKSKLAAGAEPFTFANFLLYRGKSLYTISQLEVKKSLVGIRGNIRGYALGLYMAELVEKTVEEGEAFPAIYRLLAECWHLLNEQKGDGDILARFFELKMLDLLGYRPHLDNCVFCGQAKAPFYWNNSCGGIFCGNCARGRTRMALSAGTLAFLRSLQAMPAGKVIKMRAPTGQKRELREILRHFLGYWTGIESFKTQDFLRKISDE
ncbi:MAG TPA: DNA repair protein RecO [Firmicutes bacterium]|jgi:DNA repair protein RecO (recombination protein O)|nr:DNA repair protein RecO [Bacillota bacterium]